MARRASKYGKGFYSNYSVGGRPLAKPYKKKGRHPKLWSSSGSSRKRSYTSHSDYNNADMEMPKIPRKAVIVILVIVLCLATALLVKTLWGDNVSEAQSHEITYADLTSAGHPKVFDEYDSVKQYYHDYTNAGVGSYQVPPDNENPVITAMTYLQYDYIYLFNIYLSNLGDAPVMTLEDAITIAKDYIPIEIVLEIFDFEKAIYKELDDGGISYECYYYEKDGSPYPNSYQTSEGYIPMKHGFSLIITEHPSGDYTISIGDDWYANKYDPNPVGRIGASEEELASHIEWDFRLDK